MAINNLLDFITELNTVKRDSNYLYYFRGHSDISFKLKPSIYRNQKLIRNEDWIFKEAMLRTPHEFYNDNTTLEKLVRIQHYGIPTRLLDITSNPLVALYFACNEFTNKHGKVIVFKIKKDEIKFYDSDTVSILSNLSKRPYAFRIDNISQEDIAEFNEESEIAYLLHEIREEKSYFLPIINPRDLERVVAVKVKLNNSRITRQDGAFLIFGIAGNKRKSASVPDNWIEETHSRINLQIFADRKRFILKELDNLGINQASLFPELQSLGDYLKRHYH